MRRGFADQRSPRSASWRKRQLQIMGQRVGSTQRNDAQGRLAAHQPLQYVVNSAIAAAGKYGVAPFGDGVFSLVGRIRCGAGGSGGSFNPGTLQDG